jgi:multidrug efflux system membrane fusion protein
MARPSVVVRGPAGRRRAAGRRPALATVTLCGSLRRADHNRRKKPIAMNDVPPSLLSDPSAARPGWRRRWPWLLLAALLVAGAVGAGLWYFHRPAGGDAHDAAKGSRRAAGAGGRVAPAISVAVAPVVAQDIVVTQNALGTVVPLVTVTVQAQVSGLLTQVAFNEGQNVRKGDFLVQIDPRPFEAALAQAQGQLLKDQAALEEAKMDLTRYEDLVQKKSIMRQQAEDQKWIVVQDQGAVQVDQAQVATAQINLGFCHIVSPTDGRIGLRLVDPGNFVQTGSSSASLAVITRMQPMNVVFALPEDSLPSVIVRQRTGVKLQAQAYDRSGTHLLDTGSLSAIDSQINTSTGTVNLKALFANAKDALFPNQFVNIVLRVDELKGATAVPTAAIQRGANGTFVYTVKADNTVAMVPVKIGPVDGAVAAALSGLSPGDRVVIDGADKLRDGMQVNVPEGK